MKGAKLLALATCATWLLVPACVRGAGTTGAQFLRIGIGARACAMGEACLSTVADATAIAWNPAGICQLKDNNIVFEQNFWLLDMTHQFLGFARPFRRGYWGASFYYSSSGDIPRVENFLKVGEYSAYDACASVCFARAFNKDFRAGVTAKFIQQKIENESAATFAFDLGLQRDIDIYPGVTAAVALRNLGPGIKFISERDPLPLTLAAGVSYKKDKLILASDLTKTLGNAFALSIGGEYMVAQMLALRGGYDTARSFTLGIGFYWQKFEFGYALGYQTDLDASHRFSLGVTF